SQTLAIDGLRCHDSRVASLGGRSRIGVPIRRTLHSRSLLASRAASTRQHECKNDQLKLNHCEDLKKEAARVLNSYMAHQQNVQLALECCGEASLWLAFGGWTLLLARGFAALSSSRQCSL